MFEMIIRMLCGDRKPCQQRQTDYALAGPAL